MWVSIVRSLSNRVSVKGHGFEYVKYTLNPAFVFFMPRATRLTVHISFAEDSPTVRAAGDRGICATNVRSRYHIRRGEGVIAPVHVRESFLIPQSAGRSLSHMDLLERLVRADDAAGVLDYCRRVGRDVVPYVYWRVCMAGGASSLGPLMDLVQADRAALSDTSLSTGAVFAAARGHIDILQILFRVPSIYRRRLDHTDCKGDSCLTAAAASGSMAAVYLVLGQEAAAPEVLCAAAAAAAAKDHAHVLRRLMDMDGVRERQSTWRNVIGQSIVTICIRKNALECLRFMVESGAVDAKTARLALPVAEEAGHDRVADLLRRACGFESRFSPSFMRSFSGAPPGRQQQQPPAASAPSSAAPSAATPAPAWLPAWFPTGPDPALKAPIAFDSFPDADADAERRTTADSEMFDYFSKNFSLRLG